MPKYPAGYWRLQHRDPNTPDRVLFLFAHEARLTCRTMVDPHDFSDLTSIEYLDLQPPMACGTRRARLAMFDVAQTVRDLSHVSCRYPMYTRRQKTTPVYIGWDKLEWNPEGGVRVPLFYTQDLQPYSILQKRAGTGEIDGDGIIRRWPGLTRLHRSAAQELAFDLWKEAEA